MRSLFVPLTPQVLAALRCLAQRSLRTQREQAAYLIVEGLRRTGDLACADESADSKRSPEAGS